MTTPADTAIEAAARAMAPDAWHENGRGGYTLVMADEEQARARKKARAAVIAYLTATMEPTQELLRAGCIAMRDLPSEENMAMHLADGIQKGRKKMWYRYRAMRSAELSSLKGQ